MLTTQSVAASRIAPLRASLSRSAFSTRSRCRTVLLSLGQIAPKFQTDHRLARQDAQRLLLIRRQARGVRSMTHTALIAWPSGVTRGAPA